MQTTERFYLRDIAAHLQGDYTGPQDLTCTHLSAPHDITENALVLCFERRYVSLSEASHIAGCITTAALSALIPAGVPKIIVQHPNKAMTAVLKYFERPKTVPRGTFNATASIAPNSDIHPSVHIGAHCVIGDGCAIGANVQLHSGSIVERDVHVGENTIIHSRAVIMTRTRIGKHVRIGPGAVVGSIGFSLDEHRLRPHLGGVHVGDYCSIGSNTCIDRGTIGMTRIGAFTHIDNLVQVGHNAQIGERVTICGQVGIAGGARIEDGVVLGGQSGVSQGVKIKSNSQIAAQAGVTKSLEHPGRYSGHPAELNVPRLRRIAALKQLVETVES